MFEEQLHLWDCTALLKLIGGTMNVKIKCSRTNMEISTTTFSPTNHTFYKEPKSTEEMVYKINSLQTLKKFVIVKCVLSFVKCVL